MRNTFCRTILITGIVFSGCSRQAEKTEPLRNPDFARIYAEAAILKQDPDSVRARMRIDSLLQSSGLDSALMAQEIAWLREKPRRWKTFYQEVVKILDERRREVRKKKLEARKDSILSQPLQNRPLRLQKTPPTRSSQ